MDKENLLSILLIGLIFLGFVVITGFFVDMCYHTYLHSQGYTVIDNLVTYGYTGQPFYFNVIRYSDGCIEEHRISSEDYFERVDK